MKLIYRALPIFTFLSVISINVFSQVIPPPPDLDCNPKIDPTCVPITDHIGWLIIVLIIFGITKSVQYSRNSVNA